MQIMALSLNPSVTDFVLLGSGPNSNLAPAYFTLI